MLTRAVLLLQGADRQESDAPVPRRLAKHPHQHWTGGALLARCAHPRAVRYTCE